MGYSFVSNMDTEEKHDIIEVNTPFGQDYKIHVKVDESGQMITRFVKEVESMEQTDYQKQKDIGVGNSWCKAYENIMEDLSQNGIQLEVKMLQKPEETGIHYVHKDEKSQRAKHKEEKILNQQKL